MTRGDVLQYAIAYALIRARKIVRGLAQGLSEADRHAVAEHVVTQLKERGDPWHLNEEAKPTPGHSTSAIPTDNCPCAGRCGPTELGWAGFHEGPLG